MLKKCTKILREPQVRERTGLSPVTRWRLERDGQFPKKIKLTKNTVGWKEEDINQWINSRAMQSSSD